MPHPKEFSMLKVKQMDKKEINIYFLICNLPFFKVRHYPMDTVQHTHIFGKVSIYGNTWDIYIYTSTVIMSKKLISMLFASNW